MSMPDPGGHHARDPYDADDAGSPADYPPPVGFAPSGDFEGFPRVEPAGPRIEPSPEPRRRDLWLILAAVAVLTGAAIAAILIIGPPAPAESASGDTTGTPGARATDPYPGAASDNMVRAQVGDCITFTDKDDEDSWRIVDCDDDEALGEVYAFALGTLDKKECPDLPKGSDALFHYGLDYPGSDRDDYVVCAAKLED